DIDARMMRERFRGFDAFGKRAKPARVLQRIAGRHHPPDAVEAEAAHGQQAGGAMRRMWRIERAAEQADLQSRSMRRKPDRAGISVRFLPSCGGRLGSGVLYWSTQRRNAPSPGAP